ncbi:hypothetical protein Hanom_Chr08g00748041 [Helianthus anomalus]
MVSIVCSIRCISKDETWHIILLTLLYLLLYLFIDDEVTLFTFKIFHLGEFTQPPHWNYLPGDIAYIDFADTNDFGIDVLEEMVKQVGYDVDIIFYFHYKDPNLSLDYGLRSLTVDGDF